MMFEIKFNRLYPNFWEKSVLCPNFVANGRIYLYDTALIFVGNIAKYEIALIEPFLNFISVPTVRTVPYGTIFRYERIGFILKKHKITYTLSDGIKVHIQFKIISNAKNINEVFANKLNEYLSIAKTLLSEK